MTFLVDGTNGGTFPSWTTATRPASPAVGQMGYNTTTGLFDQYTASGWSSIAASGTVLQTVQGNVTSYAATQSTSFVTTGLTASITPKFSNSKIAIFVTGQSYINATNINAYYTIFRGTVSGTNLGNATTGMTTMYSSSTSTINGSVAMSYIDSPATTSSQTYTVGFRVENAAMTAYFATNSQTNTIILMEIAV